ncbi:hypothetical protein D516_0067 [Rhodobacter sp. AKP1]|nr:hypothetical protein D516_0067 [Rhodobacter sp. AKP1]
MRLHAGRAIPAFDRPRSAGASGRRAGAVPGRHRIVRCLCLRLWEQHEQDGRLSSSFVSAVPPPPRPIRPFKFR